MESLRKITTCCLNLTQLPASNGTEPGGLDVYDVWVDTSTTVGDSHPMMIKLS